MEINGIAHVQLTVRSVEKSTPFYERLLTSMGLKVLMQSDTYFYCIGARTGVSISNVEPEHATEAFDQRRVGLHHVCFRARSREDVDAVHGVAKEIGARIVHEPEEGGFAPGYYSVLFEDPDGIRLEVNYVPGKGHFGPEGRLSGQA